MEFLSFRGGEIAYDIQGDGTPLVLVHGYLMNAQAWGKLPERLAEHMQVIRVELPGHGRSSAYPPEHSMEFMAEILLALLNHLKLDTTHLLGHSMGGYVALACLEKFPERISSMTLLNSTPFADDADKKQQRDEVIRLVHSSKLRFFLQLVLKELLPQNNHETLRKTILEDAIIQGGEALAATTRGMKQRPDRSKLLMKSTIPTQWILGSTDDQIPTTELCKRAKKEGLPEPTILETGHMSFLEQPEEIAARLLTLFILNTKE